MTEPAKDKVSHLNTRARTIKGFCAAYGVSRATVYRLLNAGQLRAVKAGERTLITEDSAEAWFTSLPTSLPTIRSEIARDAQEQSETTNLRKRLSNSGKWNGVIQRETP